MSGSKLGNDSKPRIATMVASGDGFDIAEVDLKLRGPGDLMGTQQSGVLRLKIANIIQDKELLGIARESAKNILKEDPKLISQKNRPINATYVAMGTYKNIWNYIS
jgi:ATP-dependent DNA helicase RecG